MNKNIRKLVSFFFLAIISVSAFARSYKLETKKNKSIFLIYNLSYPVFVSEEFQEFSEQIRTKVNSNFKAYSREMKYQWIDWEAANQEFYQGEKTDPFRMTLKPYKIKETKNYISVVLFIRKDDGSPKPVFEIISFFYDRNNHVSEILYEGVGENSLQLKKESEAKLKEKLLSD